MCLDPQNCNRVIVCTAMITSCLETQHHGNSSHTNNGTWQIQLLFSPLSAIYKLYRDINLS